MSRRPKRQKHGGAITSRGRNIRILFTTDSIREPLNGVGRMALTLLRELNALGHEIVPLDWRHNDVAAEAAGRCEILPPRLPWAKTALWHLDLLRRVPGLGVEHDVLFNPTGYPNALGGHPRSVLVVHDLHMLEPGYYRAFKRTWFRTWYGRCLRNTALLICPSEHTRQKLLSRYDVAPERCAVVHNALDPGFAAAMAEAQEPASGARYFLVVGTIEDRKNVHRLAEAFARCRANGLRERLIVVGRLGHGSRAFLRRIQAEDLSGAVEVLPGIGDAELCRLYRGATALLFPSLEEGFGLPILEAMHAGTAVLTSQASAMSEVAGDAALLVDPTDVAAIADGVLRLANDDGLRADLCRRGHERVRQFEAGRQARAYADHLGAVAGSYAGPGAGTDAVLPEAVSR